jgi:hypothetical protein
MWLLHDKIPQMTSRQMTEPQRAMQLWSVLLLAARTQQILSYSTVHQLTGMATVGLGGVLGPVIRYCRGHKLPWLTVLVVNEETGLPGEAFMDAARKEYGDKLDIPAMQSRVFAYDWSRVAMPSIEDFEATVSSQRAVA